TAAHAGLQERRPVVRPGVRFHAVELVGPDVQPLVESDAFPFLRHALGVHRRVHDLHARHPFEYIEFPDFSAEGFFAVRAPRLMGAYEGAVVAIRLHTPMRDCRELNRESWLDEEIAQLEYCEEEAIRGADVLVSPTRSLLERVRSRLKG